MCVCEIEFVVITDCESCTRPISTNPGSMEASEYGLTRGTCFVARRLELVAVAGLLKFCGVLRVRRDFVFSMSLHFQLLRARAVSVNSLKGQRQPANLPTESSRPPISSFLVLPPENHGASESV